MGVSDLQGQVVINVALVIALQWCIIDSLNFLNYVFELQKQEHEWKWHPLTQQVKS